MISKIYNLGRLGQSGDEISIEANDEERAAIAKEVKVLEVAKFSARIILKKTSATNFELGCHLAAEIVQACVVTLEPLVARIEKDFTRELHLAPLLRRTPEKEKEVVFDANEDDVPEEIESPHYDPMGPLMEEFVLAIDPYPRAPGVAFEAPEGVNAKLESPFAVLKGLKSGG